MATEGPASKPASSPKLEVDKLQVALERDTWTYHPDTIVYRGQEIMHIDDTRLEVIQIDFLNATPTRSLSSERYRSASQNLTAAEITEVSPVQHLTCKICGGEPTVAYCGACYSRVCEPCSCHLHWDCRYCQDCCDYWEDRRAKEKHKDQKLKDLRDAHTVLIYTRDTEDTGIAVNKLDVSAAIAPSRGCVTFIWVLGGLIGIPGLMTKGWLGAGKENLLQLVKIRARALPRSVSTSLRVVNE